MLSRDDINKEQMEALLRHEQRTGYDSQTVEEFLQGYNILIDVQPDHEFYGEFIFWFTDYANKRTVMIRTAKTEVAHE